MEGYFRVEEFMPNVKEKVNEYVPQENRTAVYNAAYNAVSQALHKYTTGLNYEGHVTIEPVFEERLEKFKDICNKHNFKVAKLIIEDSFCTGRDSDLEKMKVRMLNVVKDLKQNGFVIHRYKLEQTLVDVRNV